MANAKASLRFAGLTLGIAAALAGAAVSSVQASRRNSLGAGSNRSGEGQSPPGASQSAPAAPLTAEQAMLWKYTARCALRADQGLEATVGAGEKVTFKGELGLAPQWRDAGCDRSCQERISSCLFALTNATGKHVKVSLLSGAPDLAPVMGPSDSDREYPFQEGAFFGDMFAGQAFVCRGHDVHKGAQVKRFCALEPALCSGLAHFSDAGLCDDTCEMACSRLGDGTQRCVAVRCLDPQGRMWDHPITTYMRNRIEAGNADAVEGIAVSDTSLERLQDGGQATYRTVDFGVTPGATRSVLAHVAASKRGGRIEVWLDGRRLLGALEVPETADAVQDIRARLDARGVAGTHDVVLKFAGLDASARLTDVAFR
jgi:hypothetical protein